MNWAAILKSEPFSYAEWEAAGAELATDWLGEVSRNSPDYVRWVQQSLNQILGLRLAVDGVLGPATRSTIRRFQQRQGLTADGVVGPRTETALRAALAPGGGPPSPPAAGGCRTLDRFAFDSDGLTPAHQAALGEIARAIVASQASNQPVRTVRVIGHADPVGSDAYNLGLSQRRAAQVSRQLRAELERLQPGILRVVQILEEGRGEAQQISADAAQNRHVDVCLESVRVTPPVEPPPRRQPSRWLNLMGPDTLAGNRVQPLVDGAETFRAMAAAMRTATGRGHFIYLLGWWLDDDLPLVAPYPPTPGSSLPPVAPDPNSTASALLAQASGRGVQVRAMLWDQSGSRKNTAEVARINRLPGAAAILDNHQLSYMLGSHHQKVLIVKGSQGLIGFCGGVDINRDRVEPVHISSSSGTTGSPLHDVHCRIEGPAVRRLLDAFIQRWYANPEHRSLDQQRGRLLGLNEPMPAPLGPHCVRIGRTFNGRVDLPSGGTAYARDRSVQDLWLRAIAGAQRFIYIEDQYLVNLCAARALNAVLPGIQHLTILIPDSSISDLPQRWRRRLEFIRELRQGPHGGKVHIYCLLDPRTRRFDGIHTYVHSKMMIVDDELAVIGSANMNRRGWEHDSEVAAAIFDDVDRRNPSGLPFAQQLRMRLWSEHLNLPATRLSDGVAAAPLWAQPIPGKRVVPYNPTADTDSLRDRVLSWDGQIDLPAATRDAPCCVRFGMSCPT